MTIKIPHEPVCLHMAVARRMIISAPRTLNRRMPEKSIGEHIPPSLAQAEYGETQIHFAIRNQSDSCIAAVVIMAARRDTEPTHHSTMGFHIDFIIERSRISEVQDILKKLHILGHTEPYYIPPGPLFPNILWLQDFGMVGIKQAKGKTARGAQRILERLGSLIDIEVTLMAENFMKKITPEFLMLNPAQQRIEKRKFFVPVTAQMLHASRETSLRNKRSFTVSRDGEFDQAHLMLSNQPAAQLKSRKETPWQSTLSFMPSVVHLPTGKIVVVGAPENKLQLGFKTPPVSVVRPKPAPRQDMRGVLPFMNESGSDFPLLSIA